SRQPSPREEAMPFQEIQYPDWWVFAIVGGVGVLLPLLLVAGARYAGQQGKSVTPKVLLTVATLVFLLMGGLFVAFGRVTTEVRGGQVRTTFGWVPGYTKVVPLDEIMSAERVEYDPMADYRGWGIRGREGDRALTARGREGVRLTLQDGST